MFKGIHGSLFCKYISLQYRPEMDACCSHGFTYILMLSFVLFEFVWYYIVLFVYVYFHVNTRNCINCIILFCSVLFCISFVENNISFWRQKQSIWTILLQYQRQDTYKFIWITYAKYFFQINGIISDIDSLRLVNKTLTKNYSQMKKIDFSSKLTIIFFHYGIMYFHN